MYTPGRHQLSNADLTALSGLIKIVEHIKKLEVLELIK